MGNLVPLLGEVQGHPQLVVLAQSGGDKGLGQQGHVRLPLAEEGGQLGVLCFVFHRHLVRQAVFRQDVV